MVSQSRSGAVGRAKYKRREADRKRRAQIKALEQNAKYFDILSGAGAPPKFSGSDMGLSGRYATGGSAAGKTGWGFDEVTVGYSSGFRPQPIKQKKVWFQYQEGFRHGGGKYVGQWGTRDVRIGYEGAEDWQRKINAAWWGRQDREAEAQRVRDIQANIKPFDEDNPYFSARVGKRGAAGRAAKAQAESDARVAAQIREWNINLGIDPDGPNALGQNIGSGKGGGDWGMGQIGGTAVSPNEVPELSELIEGKSPDEVKKITNEYNKLKTQKTVTPEGKAILDRVAKYQGVKLNVYGQRTFGKVDTLEERKQKAAKDAEKLKGDVRADKIVASFTTDAGGREITWDDLKLQGEDTPVEKRGGLTTMTTGGNRFGETTTGISRTGISDNTKTKYFYVGGTKLALSPASYAYYKEQGLTPLTTKQYLSYTPGDWGVEGPSNISEEEWKLRDEQDKMLSDAYSLYNANIGSGDTRLKVKDGYMVEGKFVGDLSADALKTYAKAGTKVVKIGKLSMKDKDINKNLGNPIIAGKSEYIIRDSEYPAVDFTDSKQLSDFEKSTGVKVSKAVSGSGNPFVLGSLPTGESTPIEMTDWAGIEGVKTLPRTVEGFSTELPQLKSVITQAEENVKASDEKRKSDFYKQLADRARGDDGKIDATYGYGSSWIGTDYKTIDNTSFAQFGLGDTFSTVSHEDRDVVIENYDEEIAGIRDTEMKYQEILDKGVMVRDVPVTETRWEINTTAFGVKGTTKYENFQKQLDKIGKKQKGESDRRYERRLERSDVKLDGPYGEKITISDALERGWITGVQVDTGKTKEVSTVFKEKNKKGEWQYVKKFIDPVSGQESTGYQFETSVKAGLMQEQSKVKRLEDARSSFMTNEERLLKAEEINLQAAKRKEALDYLKDYKPFTDAYSKDYVKYLNPEQISQFYERGQELPRYAAQGVAGQYRSLLGGTGMYDVDLAEDLRAGEILKVDGQQQRYMSDEQAPGFSSADGRGMYADGEGGIVFVGKDKKTKQMRQLGGVRRENAEEQQLAEAYWVERQRQKGQLQADYSEANELLQAEKALDKRGRIRDPERYGQAIGRVYYKTKEELPKLKEDIRQMELQIGTIRELKKQSDVKYSDFSRQIAEKEKQAREAYAKTGSIQFDDAFAKEISAFGDERTKLKLDKEIQEQQLDLLKKNVAATEEELDELRKQKSDWIPQLGGGGGKIVNPARFARFQLLAGQKVTSAMSPGERSARQQVSRSVGRKQSRGAGTFAPRIIAQLGGTPGKRGQKTYMAYSRLAQLAYERGMMY